MEGAVRCSRRTREDAVPFGLQRYAGVRVRQDPGEGRSHGVDRGSQAVQYDGTRNLEPDLCSPNRGDQAGWIRWSLNRFNTHGKRIYLRKYFHASGVASGGGDALAANTKTVYDAFGAFMFGGTLLGSRTLVDKFGNVPIASASSQYITTRTLKRRAKRPPA